MNRFVQDGAGRLRQAYGEEAGARIDAGIQVLNRRYRRQMASAPPVVRLRLWLRLRLARRHLRKTVEAAYFGHGRLYLAGTPWRGEGGAPAPSGSTTARGERVVSGPRSVDRGRRPRVRPAHASAGPERRR